jgi:hypothetical protein
MAKPAPTAAAALAASVVVMVQVLAKTIPKYPVKHGLILSMATTYVTNDISLVRIFQALGR